MRSDPPPERSKYVKKGYSTRTFSNLTTVFPQCSPDEVKIHCIPVARVIISEILNDIINNLTDKASHPLKPNSTDESYPNAETKNNANNDNTEDIPFEHESNPTETDKPITLEESVVSLDSSIITDPFGNPIIDIISSSPSSTHSLNC